ncbi:MAG TPA: LysR family transcriptional regulator [Beijerinckiaceae bacterium]|nr:LysR family transcriptional regulator [Beijerinckiaceae bacterium]
MATLENISVFIRSVEAGSFSAAGRSLGLSAAVVSHRIKTLERHLGCRLFHRTTRQMRLTEQGRVFYERCIEIREAVQRAESSVAEMGAAPRGSLKITAPLGLGREVITPAIVNFRSAYPLIDVRLRLSDYLIDLLMESVDIALRMAVMEDSSLTMRKIADVDRVLVASPAYLARRGKPQQIEDLFNHECLLLRFPGSQQVRWSLLENGTARQVPVSGSTDADDGDVLTQWALGGLGIALKPAFEVSEHLRSGALETVLDDTPPMPVTLSLLYPYPRAMPSKVRAFADMVIPMIRAHLAERALPKAVRPAPILPRTA